jgi:UDP-N-acetylglucosamine acyltransferase
MSYIHPTAVIENGALLGRGVEVGPFSYISSEVVIGNDSWIGPHVVVTGKTTIGERNRLFQFSSIGAPPQDLKYRGEPSTLVIGDENIVREFVTIQPGTAGGLMTTNIGSRNLFMANAHIAHDVVLGSDCVIANSAAIAGHVHIGDRVTIGGLVGVHQFVRIGSLSIISGGSMVVKDIPPFCIAQGDRARLFGINIVGLERAGVSEDDRLKLRKLYRTLFMRGGSIMERLNCVNVQDFSLGLQFKDFVLSSERGIASNSASNSESA